MTEVKADDWRVVLVTVENAKCRLCGELVPRGEQGQHLGRVVGDAAGGGRDRAEHGQAHQRRASSAYSCGP